ncbi:MAG: histidine kinase [Actinomycetota bacterium]
MTDRVTRRLAWSIWAISIVAIVASFGVSLFGSDSWLSGGLASALTSMSAIAFIVACSTVGALVAARQPKNPIGWTLSAAGACFAIAAASIEVGPRWVRYSDWLGAWIWMVGITLAMTFVLLVFPDGHLPSRRWRPVAWFAAGGLGIFIAGSAFAPGVIEDTRSVNPFGFGGSVGEAVFGAMRPLGLQMVFVSVPLALASLVFRYRAGDRTRREQLRWLIFAGIVIGLAMLANPLVGKFVDDPSTATDIGNMLTSFSVTAIPIAIGIAILRYRLYDIDLVLNKTLVYGALAAFITGVYVAIVVGIGALVGRGGQSDVGLSIAATAVVAVAFQPVRERVQRFANRLVYGTRATPYEVLSEFSDQLGSTYRTEELLPRMARILAQGTGAARTDVWLVDGQELRADASWPDDAPPLTRVPVQPLPDDFIAVTHQGEMLGALSLMKRQGETLTATEQRLVENLAGQAGLVLRNVRLTEQLLARLEELKASRQRLVAAQDEERRKLERNIHDGAQQQLVALAVKQRLLGSLIGRDDEKAREMVAQLASDTNDALENLRDLARGIYPPLLADQGLVAALEAQARKAAVPTTVQGNGIGRFGQDVEAAVYFSCLEALQNVAKYAGASRAEIALSNGNGSLTFTVTDDGTGFDADVTSYGTGLQGIADRLAALDGTVEVQSEPGRGTTVTGRLPVETIL